MLFSEIGPDTLNRELNTFLEGSKLSLSQVAKRLGVSKGHLSEIKNGKATPALNTGLRILKICGLETEQRRAWAHFYNTSISEEYLEVHDDWEKENDRKLNEKASTLLARDLDLMNAYIDIVNSEEEGMALVDLRIEYGRAIESKLQKLCAQGVVELEQTDLGKTYRTGKVDPIITRNASYDLMVNVMNDQQVQYQAGENKGKFKFHINDVDQEGFQKLSELLKATMKEAEEIMVEHKLSRSKGGERFAFEMLLGQLKSFVLFALLGLSLFSLPQGEAFAEGGGLSGGSSDDSQIIRDLEEISWEELQKRSEFKFQFPTIRFNKNQVPVNKVCYDRENSQLKTQEKVEVCQHTSVVQVICEYNGYAEPFCTEVKVSEEENQEESQGSDDSETSVSETNSITSVVNRRVCLQSAPLFLSTPVYYKGILVNFNQKERQAPEDFRFISRNASGNFELPVPVSKEVTGLYHSELTPIGTKKFEIPSCL